MPEDILPPDVPPTPRVEPETPRSTRVICEFCGCQLDPKGNVLLRGDKARTYLDLEDQLQKLQESLDSERVKVTELTGQIEALKAPTPQKRGGFLSDI